jgi:hypothetical protein
LPPPPSSTPHLSSSSSSYCFVPSVCLRASFQCPNLVFSSNQSPPSLSPSYSSLKSASCNFANSSAISPQILNFQSVLSKSRPSILRPPPPVARLLPQQTISSGTARGSCNHHQPTSSSFIPSSLSLLLLIISLLPSCSQKSHQHN